MTRPTRFAAAALIGIAAALSACTSPITREVAGTPTTGVTSNAPVPDVDVVALWDAGPPPVCERPQPIPNLTRDQVHPWVYDLLPSKEHVHDALVGVRSPAAPGWVSEKLGDVELKRVQTVLAMSGADYGPTDNRDNTDANIRTLAATFDRTLGYVKDELIAGHDLPTPDGVVPFVRYCFG